MFARLSKLLLVAVLCGTLGLHWALLQVVAWTGMVAAFSQSVPVKEALAMTFDGQHPCNLCKFVREGHQSEQQRDAQKQAAHLDGLVVPGRALLFPPAVVPQIVVSCRPADARSESPPLPPPRALQG